MYVPRILLCGDLNSFRRATNMEVEVIGQISFIGSPECGENHLFPNPQDVLNYAPKNLHIFLNDEEISADELRKILDGAADYIVFNDVLEFGGRHNDLCSLKIFERFIPRNTLFNQARRNFYSAKNFYLLSEILRDKKISRLLDFDALFAETDFFMFPNLFPHVDGIEKNYEPIHENFYKHIYDSLADCRFKIYDALLLAERSPEEFIDVLIETDCLAEKVLTFARKNSALEKFLAADENFFKKNSAFPAVNGNWYLIQKRVPKNFKIYVVTHKKVQLDLPDGYEIIDARQNLGDNISALNLYLNEVTALYWIWKNTSQAIIGLNHYRRFFTLDGKNFLSREAAEKILKDFDIIVAENILSRVPSACLQKILSGDDLEEFVAKIFEKHIALKQPDYLDAFKHAAISYTSFQYEIFVTRRNIFEAYCEWLFSFLLDVTEEVFARTNIKEIKNPRKYRIISFITERLMTVWLKKNRLKIKTLPIIFRKDV